MLIERLARFSAILGGLVLCLLILLTCISIAGRGLNTLAHSGLLPESIASWLLGLGVAPILGDFEIVEAGISFAIFAFLPICQLYGAHARVDVLTPYLPQSLTNGLGVFWEIVLALVILLITWRLGLGMTGKIGNGETSFLLQFPVWWAYAASFAAALAASLTAIYCAYAKFAGKPIGLERRD